MRITLSLHGCRLEVAFSFLALLAFCCLFLGTGSSALFLLAVAIHEAAHVIALFCLKAPPAQVNLTALGCRIVPNQQGSLSYPHMALVSLAGPLANLLSAGILAFIGQTGNPLFGPSLALGLLHLLPVEPLDGGLALHAALCACLKGKWASRISLAVGLLFLLPLAIFGFWILLRTRYNFTLLAMSVYLMLYLVLGKDFSL